jgi:hypothetical protein
MASVVGFAGKVIMRLTSANGIHDRMAKEWIMRLASANGIRDKICRESKYEISFG